MTDPTGTDAAGMAARNALTRNYLQIFQLVRQRASGGDVVARGFERELAHTYLPAPTRTAIRRWLADVANEGRLFNRSSEPWVARQLLAEMQAVEARAPLLTQAVWDQVVLTARSSTHA